MNQRTGLWLAMAALITTSLFTTQASAQTTTRIEESAPSVTYTGTWRTIAHPSLSGGSIAISEEQGATASITFTGTSFGLISYLCPCAGNARLLVDGVPAGSWNGYSPASYAQQDFYRWGNLSPGQHTVTIEVLRLKSSASSGFWFGVDAFDIDPQYDSTPVATLTSPAAGAVTGIVTLSAEASDNTSVAKVEFYADGQLLGTDTTAPYSITRDTSGIAHGSTYSLLAVAYDPVGRSGNSAPVEVTVTQNSSTDVTPPFVELTAPETGALVTGVVTIAADGYDDVGITRVDFHAGTNLRVDEHMVIGSDTTPPYSITRDTSSLPSGRSYYLTARAYDAAGNSFTSVYGSWVTIQHEDNIRPTINITEPASGSTLSGTVRVAADASDDQEIVGATLKISPEYAIDQAVPFEGLIDTLQLTDGAHTVTASARDGQSNEGVATPVPVTVDNRIRPGVTRVDDADPALVYTGNWQVEALTSSHWGSLHSAPDAGNTVSFTFEGVGVRLIGAGSPTITIDGTAQTFGPAVNGPGFSTFESPPLAPGTHTLVLTASPTAFVDGFEVLKVADATAPTVTLTAPMGGDLLSGTVQAEATASDDAGIAKVQFFAGGTLLGEDTTAPYSVTFDSRSLFTGGNSLQAVAYDNVGRRTATPQETVRANGWNLTTAPPLMTFTNAPADGATVSGSVTFTAEASFAGGTLRDVGIFAYGDNGLGNGPGLAVPGPPYTWVMNSNDLPDGIYWVYAYADIQYGENQYTTYYSEPVRIVIDN